MCIHYSYYDLQISDQPSVRPNAPLKPEQKRKSIILTLAIPPPSDATSTRALVAGVFQFVDAVSGPKASILTGLRPESKNKLRKRREEIDADLRADFERETKEAEKEAKENALTAKRQAEKDRIASLPAAEQQKVRISGSACASPSYQCDRFSSASESDSNARAREKLYGSRKRYKKCGMWYTYVQCLC
jgi:hypothetical protein